MTWRCLGDIFLILTLSSTVVAGQNGGIVCRQRFKTSNNCYRLYRPAVPARGLVVMLPYYGSDANEFSSAALPGLLAKKNAATMVVSASGYLNDDDLVTLRGLIGEVVQELNIPPGRLVVGGISAGGTGAVRYTEYCISGHCDARSKPVAIFSVDAPLDFESWWNRETLRDVERAARQYEIRPGRIPSDSGCIAFGDGRFAHAGPQALSQPVAIPSLRKGRRKCPFAQERDHSTLYRAGCCLVD